MKVDNSGPVPVIALLDAFIAGDMTAEAFGRVYVFALSQAGLLLPVRIDNLTTRHVDRCGRLRSQHRPK